MVRAPKSSHITPILRSLHWLKINERIEYKFLSLTNKDHLIIVNYDKVIEIQHWPALVILRNVWTLKWTSVNGRFVVCSTHPRKPLPAKLGFIAKHGFGSDPALVMSKMTILTKYVFVPQHNGLIDLGLTEPRNLFRCKEDLDCDVFIAPLSLPHLTVTAFPNAANQRYLLRYRPLHLKPDISFTCL